MSEESCHSSLCSAGRRSAAACMEWTESPSGPSGAQFIPGPLFMFFDRFFGFFAGRFCRFHTAQGQNNLPGAVFNFWTTFLGSMSE